MATAGAGLGLSSVAATTLGTTVPGTLRGTASGIINTAAQLGTATGIAVLLLIAAATTGPPGPGTGTPVSWTASPPVAASPTISMSPSSSAIARRPSRTRASSWATTTRILPVK